MPSGDMPREYSQAAAPLCIRYQGLLPRLCSSPSPHLQLPLALQYSRFSPTASHPIPGSQ